MELVCRYCGKSILNVENKKFRSKKEAEEYATLNCDCYEGEKYRNRVNAESKLNKIIDELDYLDLSKEMKIFIKQCGLFVLDHETKITIEIANVKLKFQFKKNDLEFEFIQTNKQKGIV